MVNNYCMDKNLTMAIKIAYKGPKKKPKSPPSGGNRICFTFLGKVKGGTGRGRSRTCVQGQLNNL